MDDRYFIKRGYRATDAPKSLDSAGSAAYWNESRIAASASFQYYVYALSRDLIRKHGYKSVLDVGCGPPTKLMKLIEPVCSDIVLIDQPSSTDLVRERAPSADFIPTNLEEIDLDLGRRFDLVVCADVVEHLLDPDPCVEFVRRHLAESGRAIFSTPERDNLRGPECMSSPHPEHVREWTRAEFADYLRSRGFQIERHPCFPMQRTHPLGFAASRALSRFFRRKAWASCQVAVCRPGRA